MTNTNYSAKVIHGEYFPHIDGIRALAVLPVVLFHTLASLCPGGFAGVDVFFVISGYLITGGILRDLQNGRFTIRNFYHRRIRRIMPAYFTLIAGVFTAGCALYYATPLVFLGDAVAAGTLFVANFHFWMLGGDYFSQDLHSHPLLHLWSLSVEEQFYLFIPVICAIIWKINRRWVATVLALFAILSLASSMYAILVGNKAAAFYFLPFRAWELLVGSLLAIPTAVAVTTRKASSRSEEMVTFNASHKGNEPIVRRSKSTWLATIGFLLVMLPYAFLTPATAFPGATALPSVIGTALLIRYGHTGLVSQLLAWKPLVSTGKISYSLYLWHWPVTVFWKYVIFDQVCWYDYSGMFLLSVLLGYLSWKYVEMPVRSSQAWTMGRSFTYTAVGIALLVTLGTASTFYKGWPTVLHSEANEVAYMPPPRDPFVVARTTAILRRMGRVIGRPSKLIRSHDEIMEEKVAMFHGQKDRANINIGASGSVKISLLGDSHAGALRSGFDQLLSENNIAGHASIYFGTDMFNLDIPYARDALNKLAELPLAKRVILVQNWKLSLSRHTKNHTEERVYAKLETYSRHIQSLGKTLFIATDIPHFQHNAFDIEARRRIIPPRDLELSQKILRQTEDEYKRQQGEINRRLEKICNETGAILIPLHLAFQQGNYYSSFEIRNNKTVPLYRDNDHLSIAGSLRAAQFIMSRITPIPDPEAVQVSVSAE